MGKSLKAQSTHVGNFPAEFFPAAIKTDLLPLAVGNDIVLV